MDTKAREQAADLENRLLTAPHRFTMMQTLWLLSALNAESAEECDRFMRRNIRVVPWLSLAFPPSEVVSVEKRERDSEVAYRVILPYYGLYSTMGALPTFYTEELLDEAREDDSISRDFLDIINNHLYHLLYAANRHSDLVRRTVESANRTAEFIQYSLVGQAEEELRDEKLYALAIADVLAQRSRSAVRLERYLAFVLARADVEVEQCVERRAVVPPGQRCALGKSNCRLGNDAVLGESVADSTGKFRVHLRGTAPAEVGKFLPKETKYADFPEQIKRFLDAPLDYDMVLHPDDSPPPRAALGKGAKIGFFLGMKAEQPVRVSWKKL